MYKIELADHWRRSIDLALRGKANKQQLECMQDLAETEFSQHDMQLRADCFWRTQVDCDGDVVLLFVDPVHKLIDGVVHLGQQVNVYIDHCSLLMIKNLLTGRTWAYSPFLERLLFPEKKSELAALSWFLPEAAFTPFVRSATSR